MAVGNQAEKPRFFIDLLNYNYHIGNVEVAHTNWQTDPLVVSPHAFDFSPVNPYLINTSSGPAYFKVALKTPISVPSNAKMFVAILGHEFNFKNLYWRLNLGTSQQGFSGDNSDYEHEDQDFESIVNGHTNDHYNQCDYNGWSLSTFTPSLNENIMTFHFITQNVNITSNPIYSNVGSIAIGYVYEPEFHADLSVTQRRIMDGVKQKQTKGGSTYSVINHIKPPNWWNSTPFELYTDSSFKHRSSRLGRRSWDVRFSQLQDRFYTDGVPNGVFPANELVGTHEADLLNGGYTDGEDVTVTENADGTTPATGDFNYNINSDNSLYSTVYHNTLGGTLPFLFSPSQDNSPGNFAICRFDKPGFQVQQKTYKKFNVKMRINETW